LDHDRAAAGDVRGDARGPRSRPGRPGGAAGRPRVPALLARHYDAAGVRPPPGRLFPVGGYGTGVLGHLHSLFLPALTVALGISPLLIRSLRASLLQVLESDYVTTARSKGLSERRVLARHALRNAVVSTVAVLGVNIAFLIGGTVIIEQVFALPGIGQLMLSSIFQRDFPVVQGVTLVFGIMVVLVYLATDVLHSFL